MADTRIDELRRRLERDPGSRLFAQLAEELRKGGELAEAIRVARAGLAVHPSYPSARLTLGRALLESGDSAGSRVELESAVREAPDNILASRFLAQAREALGDLKGAVEQYQKTLLMAPGDRQLQGALAAVEARLKAPAAAAASGEAVTTPPAPRRAPPPLPAAPAAPGAAATPAAAAGKGGPTAPSTRAAAEPGIRAGAPPVVFSPTPSVAPAEDLPATLRIKASQTMAPEPEAPPPRPAPPPPPPPPSPPEPSLWSDAGPAIAGVGAPPAVEASTLPGGAADRLVESTTVPPEPPPPPSPSESTTPFSSSTLAELYFQQGLVDRAKGVYRQLVEEDPGNEKARSRLAELERGGASGEERAARRRSLERTIAGLETLLAAVRRR